MIGNLRENTGFTDDEFSGERVPPIHTHISTLHTHDTHTYE